MKKLLAGVAVAALLTVPAASISPTSLSPVTPAMAQQASVSVNLFYDRLGDHGRWVRHSRHRYVWVPMNVDPDWRPYSRGRWVYTERYGWYFASDEPFGWAVYHYGRWAYEPRVGWYWVPGTRWAPAWVSWRRSGDHVGWAPLPPEGSGFAVSIEIGNPQPPPGYWVFVPVRRFAAADLATVIVPRNELRVIYDSTEFVGPVVVQQNVVVNNVIDIDFIQQNAEEEVTVTEVQEVSDPAAAAESGDGTVAAFTGELSAEEDSAPAEAVEPDDVDSPTVGQEELADEAPADEAPAEEAPAEEAPAEEAPAEEAPAEEAPAEQAPAEEAPAEEAPAEEAPAEEAPAEQAPAEQPAAEQPPAQEAPAQEAPAEEAPAQEAPAQEAPAEQPAAEQPPAQEEAPAQECTPERREAGEC